MDNHAAGKGTETEEIKIPTVGNAFIGLAATVQAVVIVGFLLLGKSTRLNFNEQLIPLTVDEEVRNVSLLDIQLYNNYVGVTLMMFVGFGYLMTFLRYYGLGAVGLTMFVTCLGMQVAILMVHIFHAGFEQFEVNVMMLLEGDFAVATFLISFGGLIGKVNPAQLVVMTVLEAVFYAANYQLFLGKLLDIKDVGGSIGIHMFGAYFGLAASRVLGQPKNMDKEASSSTSDLFSFIGTVILWVYWPSFVAGWLPAGTTEADTAITNTVLSLLGSTVCTFILSAVLSGKILRPVDIQNATLAGGVTIGALANLNITPGGAILVGCSAGLLSTFGFCKVQGFLHAKIGLHDTCGIHNLHGMPSVLGGVLSIFVKFFASTGAGGPIGEPTDQLLGVVGTIVISVVTGAATGCAMKVLKDDSEGFNDKMYWEVAEEEENHDQVAIAVAV